MHLTKSLAGLGGVAWIGSWYLMYLEITRWHHVKPSLAFNSDMAPDAHPGQALLLLYVACVGAPLVVLATAVNLIIHSRRRHR
ncbi:hypothetical protein HFP15_37905 [Amycolatopsis sp. K13G38]|uniref:Uncharacterized protein n=1 Tax=Amycolatopsis acididurans TaxID=2724524 RepID=A0ABX1JFV3_9PSEU|nr:hypothetical protein [Amycolatopsis acididurans]NKQ58634.1 hypothetical protein [Amycolatopsis acididurans]